MRFHREKAAVLLKAAAFFVHVRTTPGRRFIQEIQCQCGIGLRHRAIYTHKKSPGVPGDF
jgi:hypothetical protein